MVTPIQMAILLLMTVYALWTTARSVEHIIRGSQLQEDGLETTGVILEARGGTSSIDPPVVAYRFRTDDGKFFQGASVVDKNTWRTFSAGDSISVIYFAEDPTNNAVSDGKIVKWASVDGLVAGLLLILISIGLLLIAKNETFRHIGGRLFRGVNERKYRSAVAQFKELGLSVPDDKLEAFILMNGNVDRLVSYMVEMKMQGEAPDFGTAVKLTYDEVS